MAGRGRPKLSEDEKARRKEAKESRLAGIIAENALAKMPAERDKRNELFAERDDLVEEKKAIGGKLSAQNKRMSEVFGLTKPAIKIRDILEKCRDGVYEATVQQVKILVEDMNRPFQLSMFQGTPGQGGSEAAGTVFDSTSAGAATKHMKQRGPNEKDLPPAPVDTGKATEAEVMDGIKPVGTKAAARGGKKVPPPPPPVGDAPEDDVRPRHLRQNEQDREDQDDEGPVRSPVPDDEPTGSFRILN